MCRLAVFPPKFPREAAIDIVENFLTYNKDGYGEAHVQDGKFCVSRHPGCFEAVKTVALAHMPYPGWTIAHVRAKTHGECVVQNTHPFIHGKWCLAHNGQFAPHELIRAATPAVKYEGECDSETAAYFLNAAGPLGFLQLIHSGIYVALNTDGEAYVMNLHGDLEVSETEYGFLFASDLPKAYAGKDVKACMIRTKADTGEIHTRWKWKTSSLLFPGWTGASCR